VPPALVTQAAAVSPFVIRQKNATLKKFEDVREARPSTSVPIVIARWGSRSADIAEKAAKTAGLPAMGDAVGKTCGPVYPRAGGEGSVVVGSASNE